MAEVATEEVRKTIIISVSPEVAFRALTDEIELTQWFSNERTVLEPQVGGAWMLKNCRFNTGETHTMRGKILEIIQDKKLSYTWNVDEYPDSPETLVTWMIEPLDGGISSEIKLVHSDLVDDADGLDRSWSYFIGRFAEYCKEKHQSPPT